MSSKTVFTKKDVFVIMVCGIFLLATVGSVGVSGRRRAKEAVCLSNLRQWGTIFLAFAADNDGYFMKGWSLDGQTRTEDYWMEALRPYYGNNHDLRCCPEATTPGTTLGLGQYGGHGTFVAWGVFTEAWAPVVPGDYGSYGMNGWACNPPPQNVWWGTHQQDFNWRTANVAGAENIPLFGGHQFLDCWPSPYDKPPDYDGQPWMQGSQMGRVCVNRHNGSVNWVFLDASARKVPLKCLWKLQWHRRFNPDYGPTEEEFNYAGDGWMAEFPPCE
jgi:prepilin-type processing-associated H-X9-DG protein